MFGESLSHGDSVRSGGSVGNSEPVGGSPTSGNSIDITRQQYRVALVRQLRVGLEENRQIDLRDAKHEVVVAFADEPILPVWHDLALGGAALAHLFVAPDDFESGRLTMLSLTEGSRELADSDLFLDPQLTFGELVAQLRRDPELMRSPHGRRVNVIDAPASVYHDGLAYSFAFSQLIDV